MKNRLKTTISLFLLCLTILQAEAQDRNEDVSSGETTKLLIPVLNVLIDSALVNNGMLNYRRLEMDAKESNLKSKRRDWTKNFGLQADTRYGTFDNFSSNIDGSNTTTISSFTKQLNYGVGLYLKIPVFDILNRNSQIKQAKAELAQAKSLIKFQEDELKETVIRHYEELILRQSLLELRASNVADARVNMEMAEKKFRNGLMPIYEYVRISDITSRIASEYESAKSDLLLSKKLLENITGVSIN
jgi:outer membrane protein TolC